MSTKATIQALSDANLADASNITAEEHRAVNDEMIDEFYGETAIHETQSSGTITAIAGSCFYDIYISKQGNRVKIKGVLTNGTTGITSTLPFFEIIDADYLPYLSGAYLNNFIKGFNSSTGVSVSLRIDNTNILRLSGTSLGVSQSVYVDFEYLTQN